MILLRQLRPKDENAFWQARKEAQADPSNWPYFLLFEEGMQYTEYLEILQRYRKGENLPRGHVAATMLFAFLDDVIVGRSSIRHELNDFLLNYGGNIGYGVFPPYRRKGYGTQILQESLAYCKKLYLKKILITCDDDNEASIRLVEKHSAKLENKIQTNQSDSLTRRYWLDL